MDRMRTTKVFSLLKSLSEARHARLTDLATMTGFPLTTTHRLVGELVDLGMVERTAAGFRLGSALLDLAESAPIRSEFREAAQPFLLDLVETTRHTVHASILDGHDTLFIEKLSGHGAPVMPSRIGGRVPAHATAFGKCLMAFLPLADLASLGPFSLRRVGPRTVGSWPVFAEQISATRDRGFAVDYEEWRPGLATVAAPARSDGMTTVAISITCRASADIERLGPIVKTAAERIAQRLRDANSLPVAV
jgi:IclR family acetate operon transcriptional repressor